jgi:hypothetical protein
MKKISVIFIATSLLLSFVISCVDRLDVSTETELIGIVVEKSTNAPIHDILVKVTDGHNVYASTTTSANGSFRLTVNFNKINDSYYLLLDGSPNLPSKRENLHGMGNETYDYGYIVLYDKTDVNVLPQVTTGEASNVEAHSATTSGVVSSSGGYPLKERGICFSTHQSPSISDAHSTAGTEAGSYSCNLTNLQKNTTYYYRAYATNSVGTSYGAQKSFTTTDGKPKVTTTTPTRNGTIVTTGGNVISDGGYSITARGVCWGTTPNPDLSPTYNHTTNSSGTGPFSSTFEMPLASIYYIRAYATNANGTAYGEEKTIDHPYYELPTFTFGGQTYRVAPAATNTYTWSDANLYCDNLHLYGFTDWRLPTRDELWVMYQNRNTIGGFGTSSYWSSTICSQNGDWITYYYLMFSLGEQGCHPNSNTALHSVRPIRVDN